MCSTHNLPGLDIGGSAVNGKDGWTATGRHGEVETGSSGGGTAGTMSDDSVNGTAGGGGTADELKVKKSGDRALLKEGTDADLEHGAAADGDSQTGEAGADLVSADSCLVTEAPADMKMMAQLDGDLKSTELCDSSLEKEREAGVLESGRCALEKAEVGDLASAINSGSASSDSSLTWTFPFQTCSLRAFWGYNKTHDCGNK